MQTTMKIIRQSVDAVLDKYLAGELRNQVAHELVNVIRADLAEHEPDRLEAESNFRDCVNELCLKCGNYHESYLGACDGCRWKAVKEGFR